MVIIMTGISLTIQESDKTDDYYDTTGISLSVQESDKSGDYYNRYFFDHAGV